MRTITQWVPLLLLLLTTAAQARSHITVNPDCATSTTAPCAPFAVGADGIGRATVATLPAAFEVLPAADTERDVITYHCERAVCHEAPFTFNRAQMSQVTLTRARTIAGLPAGEVIFRRAGADGTPVDSPDPILVFTEAVSGIELDGFTVDGLGYEAFKLGLPRFPWTLVSVRAHNTTIKNSTLRNGAGGSCLRVDSSVQQVRSFRLVGSHIQDCIRWSAPQTVDTHGFHTCTAKNVELTGNTFERNSGDGVQLENKAACGMNVTYAWRNVTISGNTFRTAPDERLGGLTPGENAIDIKDGEGGLTIFRNTISGFRGSRYDSATRSYLGTGTGTGTGSSGEGIVVHASTTRCNSPNPLKCLVIEENEFTDVPVGISLEVVGHLHVLIARNTFHNLSADAPYESNPATRGVGVRVGSVAGLHLIHNTFANTPGLPLYGEWGKSHTDVRMNNNLFSYAGVGCTLQDSAFRSGYSFCRMTPQESGSWSFCHARLANDIAFENDSASWRPVACGSDAAEKASQASYRLVSPNPELLDKAVQSTYSGSQLACAATPGGTPAYDPGAHEYCP